MKKVLVSIIIVNYNGRGLLKIVLNSLKKQAFKNYEIIVVDNASTDGSVDFIKENHKQVRIVQNKENEGHVGINSATNHCKGKYVLFLSNDIELDKDCLSELLKVKESSKVAMAAPRLVNFYDRILKSGGTWVSRAFYNGHLKAKGNEKVKEIPYMGIGLIEKTAIKKFGYLFDKDYFIYAEDLDLGLRLRLLGLKVMFAPKAVAYHMHAATMAKERSYKRTFLMERNLLATFLKILSLKNILIYLPYVIGVRLIGVLRDFLTLNFMNGFARICSFLWVICNIDKILKKRKYIQKIRKISDEFLFEVFSEKELFKLEKFIV